MKRWLLLAGLLSVLGMVGSVSGAGLIIIDETHWWPGPHPPIPPPRPNPPWRPPRPIEPPPRTYIFAPLEVNSVKINTKINDQVAVTSVDEEFFNPNPARLEGTFVFPV